MTQRSLVLRIWADNSGTVQGQLIDPLTSRRQPFRDAADLWGLLTRLLTESPATPPLHNDWLTETDAGHQPRDDPDCLE